MDMIEFEELAKKHNSKLKEISSILKLCIELEEKNYKKQENIDFPALLFSNIRDVCGCLAFCGVIFSIGFSLIIRKVFPGWYDDIIINIMAIISIISVSLCCLWKELKNIKSLHASKKYGKLVFFIMFLFLLYITIFLNFGYLVPHIFNQISNLYK